ncbi:MAG TPA: hypothetical protein VGA66_17935 [Mycobacterium sp.]|jgi:hypothetical protein
MLFVHDVHVVMGEHEFTYEDIMREEYVPAVADDDTRVLWFLHSTHGSGDAYHIVMITAVRDGVAWDRFVERQRYGDLGDMSTRLAALRYTLSSSLLVSTDWSPLCELDLTEVPSTPTDHPVSLYREDTLTGPGVMSSLESAASQASGADDILSVTAAFRPAWGGGRQARVLYRIAADTDRWTAAFGSDTGWRDWPGSLTPSVPVGVRGVGRMLRTTSWSPLP